MDQPKNRYRLIVQDVASADYSRGEELDVETLSCLRYLPGRRTVWKVSCQGHEVLLKVFEPHPKQGRDADREWHHSSKLHAAGLTIPPPLFRAKGDGGLVAVAYHFIEDGRTLDKVLADADEETQLECMRQLVVMHARQHAFGSYQSDDHLGNYLWSRGQLYMLDAGSCVLKPESLGLDERVKNMAMLTANIPMSRRPCFDRAYSHYEALCPEGIDKEAFERAMERAVPEAVIKRLWSYLRKTRRSSSKLERQDYPGRSWHACRDMDAGLKKRLLEDPEQFFTAVERRVDREAKGASYSEVDLNEGGESYVLRRYDQPGVFRSLGHFFSCSHVLDVWSSGHALRMVGMVSPRPIACMTLKKRGIQRGGYLLLEKVEGEPLDVIDGAGVTAEVQEQLSRMWGDLKTLRASHRGIQAGDLMLADSGVLTLVDTGSLRFHQSAADYARHAAGTEPRDGERAEKG